MSVNLFDLKSRVVIDLHDSGIIGTEVINDYKQFLTENAVSMNGFSDYKPYPFIRFIAEYVTDALVNSAVIDVEDFLRDNLTLISTSIEEFDYEYYTEYLSFVLPHDLNLTYFTLEEKALKFEHFYNAFPNDNVIYKIEVQNKLLGYYLLKPYENMEHIKQLSASIKTDTVTREAVPKIFFSN